MTTKKKNARICLSDYVVDISPIINRCINSIPRFILCSSGLPIRNPTRAIQHFLIKYLTHQIIEDASNRQYKILIVYAYRGIIKLTRTPEMLAKVMKKAAKRANFI